LVTNLPFLSYYPSIYVNFRKLDQFSENSSIFGLLIGYPYEHNLSIVERMVYLISRVIEYFKLFG